MAVIAFIHLLLLFSILPIASASFTYPLYFCTAADHKYFNHLLNLIGSIHHNCYDQLAEIAVFDLGLNPYQKSHLNKINKLTVHNIELTHPDLLKPVKVNYHDKQVPGWYAWKPVILKQALDKFPYVLWLDAATTVLKPIDDLFEEIISRGYFFATIGDEKATNNRYQHDIWWQTTKYIKGKYQLNNPENSWILEQEGVMAGVIGVSQSVKKTIVQEMYELTKDLRNFVDDGTTPNGFGSARYEQAILSILCYLRNYYAHKQYYMQKRPMILAHNKPFYITWHRDYVCDKTHLYSSRGDLSKSYFYKKQIRYKK